MVITSEIAKDILREAFNHVSAVDFYRACEEYDCAMSHLFPDLDELLIAIEEGEITID